MLSKTDLKSKISSAFLKKETFYISEIGENVVIKSLTGESYLDISNKSLVKGDIDKKLFFRYAICESLFDLDDNKIFDYSKAEDIDVIKVLPADIYSEIVRVITNINNIGEKVGASKAKN